MKLVALLLVLSVIAANAQTPTTVPNWASSQGFTDYGTCIQTVMAGDPCTSSSNKPACMTAGAAYITCWVACFAQTSYSSFRSCTTTCGNTAKTADSTLGTLVSSSESCFSKLSSSLLTLSAFLLAAFALLF
ncbi:hypothetical protein TTHERM_01126350 (macronuclear) [Tetrahymena thermophila SB210]|uniref:Transmembrane protein n=1 Tax=Tetrahymena thermophila (strain SB210) TaxID=312017 RepID=Q24DD4_TETTS|nr:hypothetical protein TTHERM_01126350 [Tetrahymena thermophila SB210]EAS05771.1 hypothetical protein TTHERM_01126350 [Tetrahymena thermophila SB210]|eukprot:XP_001026016.1 hypothetical protein TTHERM_01126350 [Tetrahymena thermophila SB210]